jgi:hypothetical protein
MIGGLERRLARLEERWLERPKLSFAKRFAHVDGTISPAPGSEDVDVEAADIQVTVTFIGEES